MSSTQLLRHSGNSVRLRRVRVCSVGDEIPYRRYTNIGDWCESLWDDTELVGWGLKGLQKKVPAIMYFFRGIPAPSVRVKIMFIL